MKMLSLFSLCVIFVNRPLLSYIAASRSYTFLHARRIQYYDEKKLLQSEIQTFTNVTKIECSGACGREKICLSFLFYSDVPKCVTLRERFEHCTVTTTAVRGYELFQTDKPLATVGTDCELDMDCKPLSNSHCRNGSCTCDIGHRPEGNTCHYYPVACVSTSSYTWDVDSDMCYRIETRDKKSWADAERSCNINQGHLIKPNTASKHDKLRALLNETSLDTFWIGAWGMGYANMWLWYDNTAIPSMKWAPGEPSGDGRCMDVRKDQAYYWNDEECSLSSYYVCEIPLN